MHTIRKGSSSSRANGPKGWLPANNSLAQRTCCHLASKGHMGLFKNREPYHWGFAFCLVFFLKHPKKGSLKKDTSARSHRFALAPLFARGRNPPSKPELRLRHPLEEHCEETLALGVEAPKPHFQAGTRKNTRPKRDSELQPPGAKHTINVDNATPAWNGALLSGMGLAFAQKRTSFL